MAKYVISSWEDVCEKEYENSVGMLNRIFPSVYVICVQFYFKGED